MVLDGTLKHWNNGEPVIPDDGLLELKYWLNGEPYLMVEPTAAGVTLPLFIHHQNQMRA